MLLAGVAPLQPPPVSVLLAVLRHNCLSRLSCSLQVLPALRRRPSICHYSCPPVCRVACRCRSSQPPPVSLLLAAIFVLFVCPVAWGGVTCSQLPPVSLLFAVVVACHASLLSDKQFYFPADAPVPWRDVPPIVAFLLLMPVLPNLAPFLLSIVCCCHCLTSSPFLLRIVVCWLAPSLYFFASSLSLLLFACCS